MFLVVISKGSVELVRRVKYSQMIRSSTEQRSCGAGVSHLGTDDGGLRLSMKAGASGSARVTMVGAGSADVSCLRRYNGGST